MEVLDRVLDKGIVIDAYVDIALVGITLLSVDAHVIIASIETYLEYADEFTRTAPSAGLGATTERFVLREVRLSSDESPVPLNRVAGFLDLDLDPDSTNPNSQP